MPRHGSKRIRRKNVRPLITNIKIFQPPLDINLEQWDTAFDSQGKAFLVSVREALSMMRDGGRIFAITYAEGSRTGCHQPWVAMGAAKAALESLVRHFEVAVAKRGITVNAISPGWTEDSVLNTLPEQVQQLIRNWHIGGWTPMGRLGTPADIGDVVVLLCSKKARWITGQVIYADGGASLMNPEVPPEIQIGSRQRTRKHGSRGHGASAKSSYQAKSTMRSPGSGDL